MRTIHHRVITIGIALIFTLAIASTAWAFPPLPEQRLRYRYSRWR